MRSLAALVRTVLVHCKGKDGAEAISGPLPATCTDVVLAQWKGKGGAEANSGLIAATGFPQGVDGSGSGTGHQAIKRGLTLP